MSRALCLTLLAVTSSMLVALTGARAAPRPTEAALLVEPPAALLAWPGKSASPAPAPTSGDAREPIALPQQFFADQGDSTMADPPPLTARPQTAGAATTQARAANAAASDTSGAN